MKKFEDVHEQCIPLFTDEERCNDQNWYDDKDEKIFDFKHRAINHIRELKEKQECESRESHNSKK